jgi:hypothetical protein
VGGQDSIVRLNNGGRNTRSWVDGKLQLAFLSVVGGQTLKEQGAKTGASASTERVEDEEALERAAIVYGVVSVPAAGLCQETMLPATRRMRSITESTSSLPMV